MLVGPEFGSTVSSFEHYKDVKEVEALLAAHPLLDFCILVKGANSMKLSELPASL